MGLTWVACDARTGVVLADLPLLRVERVGAVLGGYVTADAVLPLPGAPENWGRATQPKDTVLVLVDEDTEAPQWGGWVTSRRRDASDEVPLSLITFEGYLARQYVTDLTFTGTGQCAIVQGIVDACVLAGSTTPLRVQVVGADTTTRDKTYQASQHKTVLAALQELSGLIGGPEFTVGWERTVVDGKPRYTPVLYVGNRIGTPQPAGLDPAATFEMPGPVTAFELVEDYGQGKGANSVTAYSSGSGEAVPSSATVTSGDMVGPKVEYHWTPSTSITESGTLDAHASRALAALAGGGRTLSLTADWDTAPVLGVDWSLGDDVGYRIGGPASEVLPVVTSNIFGDTFGDTFGVTSVVSGVVSRESVPAFPGGLWGVARCIGWEVRLPVSGPVVVVPVLRPEAWEA